MLSQLRAAATLLGVLTILLGILYPATMTAIAGAVMPGQANGSLLTRDGQPVGSSLIGQAFTQPGYLQGRPSAAGNGYDGASSSGTNLGPTSAKLADRLKTDGEAMKAETGAALLPADAITTSGSGLDPDVSPAFADIQVARIAAARNISADEVRRLIARNTAGRTFGVLGEPRVNVLAVNLALDTLPPAPTGANEAMPTASVAAPAN
ncbi:potassium-transporting ATPase subunit KdpC [Aureimonas sp. SK2]|uniref:potassium-transporting ATPase subunit KdpC n=1 Tax=Aureimonas sp. SK2 TaxID=3015992 RepID=UPI0024443923|nr:potassium-transporting ATPase subunit KdpC [Aureimonas sp. SK2]